MVETRYAVSGGVNIAYQVIGDGPRDLVYVPGWVSNIEVMWEDPGLAVFLRRLSSFSRLITFDKRGTGLSDSVPVDSLPDLETRMDDLRAVMDEVGCERATLFGHSEGAALCVVFAASHPDRTEGLILSGAFAKRVWSEDYPWAPTQQQRDELVERTRRDWGREDHVPFMALSRIDDPAFGAWLRRYERLSASPQAAAALLQMNSQIDVRPVLGAVSVPTLASHRRLGCEDRRWTVHGIGDSRGQACRTSRRGPLVLGWGQRAHHARDRRVHDGQQGWRYA